MKRCKLFPQSLRNAAYDHSHALMSEATASLPAQTDDGDADESASLEQAASEVRQDGQPVGIVEVTGDRCCHPVYDDRLITDYHVTMIGYIPNTYRHSHPSAEHKSICNNILSPVMPVFHPYVTCRNVSILCFAKTYMNILHNVMICHNFDITLATCGSYG